jgi:hypothetical protein
MESDNFVAGSTGWRIDEDGDAEFHDVRVRGQIIASVFRYDATSTVGGIVMIAPASTLAADITDVATTVTVEDAEFVNNDFLVVKVGGGEEIMKVTAGGGTTTLTVTRGVAGTPAAWKKGTAITRRGDRIVLDTISANSPYLDVIDYTGPLYNDDELQVRLGNLAGVSDPYMTPTGYGLYSDNAFLSGTLVVGSGAVVLDDDGLTIVSTDTPGDVNRLKFTRGGDTIARVETQSVLDGSDYVGILYLRGDNAAGTAPLCDIEINARNMSRHGINLRPDPLTYVDKGLQVATSHVTIEDIPDVIFDNVTRLRGASGTYPELGSTTSTLAWGNIRTALTKDVFVSQDARGLGGREIYAGRTAPGYAEDDFDDTGITGWSWAGSPFNTPTVYNANTSVLSCLYVQVPVIDVATRAFLYRSDGSFDTPKSCRVGMAPGVLADYTAYRFDDGTDNNYVLIWISYQAVGYFRLQVRWSIGGTPSYGTAVDVPWPGWYHLTLSLSGTRWSNWGVTGIYRTDGPGSMYLDGPSGLTWTPTRRGIEMQGQVTWTYHVVDWTANW